MSATGSVVIILESSSYGSLPRCLCHAGDVALMRPLPEADPAQPEFAQVAARTAAQLAPVVLPHFELRLQFRFLDQARLGHQAAAPSRRSGMPISSRNATACSSFCAVVTIAM